MRVSGGPFAVARPTEVFSFFSVLEMGHIRPGPPSTSDRLSHRTDKSWRTQRDSQGGAYPPSRPSYSTGRPPSRPHSTVSSSHTSSSSSEGDSTQDDPRAHMPPPPQPLYGYEGFYPTYAVAPYPPSVSHYPGTIKSAKSVPALLGPWDREPCPVHGVGPLSLPPPPPLMAMPPPRRAASIYDMRLLSPPPPPGPIYGTLPVRPAGDRRSLAIPPQLLPPMARPRPLVVSEDGTTEPLPVRSPPDKPGASLTLAASAKLAADDARDSEKRRGCRGGVCVGLIVLGVVSVGLLLGVLLVFIL